MKLDERILWLVAVGASISANCQPCLLSNVSMALECGIDEEEIAEAIEVGKRVRRGAASKVDQFVANLGKEASLVSVDTQEGCGCH